MASGFSSKRDPSDSTSPRSTSKRLRSNVAHARQQRIPRGARAAGSATSPALRNSHTGSDTPREREHALEACVSHSAQRSMALSAAYLTGSMGLSTRGTFTPAYSASHEIVRSSGRRVPSDMRMAGMTFKDIGLGLSHAVDKLDSSRRALDLERELELQKQFPPVLPPSKVPDLAPKVTTEVLLPIPPDASEEERRRIEERNNTIAQTNKVKDRERNNMAAKKSRELRLESLNRTKDMLAEATAENNWLRLRLLVKGDREALTQWEEMRQSGVTENMVDEVRNRIEDIEHHRAETKKKRESQARVILNRERSLVRASSSARMSKDKEVAKEVAALQEAHGMTQMEALQLLDERTSRTPSSRLTGEQTRSRTPTREQNVEESIIGTPQCLVISQTDSYSTPVDAGGGFSEPDSTTGPLRGPSPFLSEPRYDAYSEAMSFIESPSIEQRRRFELARLHGQLPEPQHHIAHSAAAADILASLNNPQYNMSLQFQVPSFLPPDTPLAAPYPSDYEQPYPNNQYISQQEPYYPSNYRTGYGFSNIAMSTEHYSPPTFTQRRSFAALPDQIHSAVDHRQQQGDNASFGTSEPPSNTPSNGQA